MAPVNYPCGPVAFDDDQQYDWRPGYDSKREEERRHLLETEQAAIEMELRPPTPTDKASLEYLRMKLRNAAFFVNGVDIEKLFRHYDLDNNGILDVDEFTQALRKDCDMSEDEVSQEEIQKLFDSIDIDLSGEVDAAEFRAWLDDHELNPYVKVYERAITQAENAGEDHPATFRDPRTHTMISKRLLLHKAKLWESFNHGESTFAFDLEEDRPLSDGSDRFFSPLFQFSNAYYLAFRAIDMPPLEECRATDDRVYGSWLEQSRIHTQLCDLCDFIRTKEQRIEAILTKLASSHADRVDRKSMNSRGSSGYEGGRGSRSPRTSASYASSEGSLSEFDFDDEVDDLDDDTDDEEKHPDSDEDLFSARDEDACQGSAKLGESVKSGEPGRAIVAREGPDSDGAPLEGLPLSAHNLPRLGSDRRGLGIGAESQSTRSMHRTGSASSLSQLSYKAAKREKARRDRAMDSVLAMRAGIKQAKMEIDRLSVLFDDSHLQDPVGTLDFIPTEYYHSNAKATLDADKAAKAVAAEKKRDMKKWAGKKEELFKLIRTRLVAQAYVQEGVDLAALFRFYDKDNSGELDFEEFCEAIRKQARIPAAEIPDGGLQVIFDDVDADGGGTVDIMEFVEWLDPYADSGKATVTLDTAELQRQENIAHRSTRWRLAYQPVVVCDEKTHSAWLKQASKQEAECNVHDACLKEVQKLLQVRKRKEGKLSASRRGSQEALLLLDDAVASARARERGALGGQGQEKGRRARAGSKSGAHASATDGAHRTGEEDHIYASVKLRVFLQRRQFKHATRTLRRYSADAALQLEGVKAFWLLAQASRSKPEDVIAETRKALTSGGAIGAVVAAMHGHSTVFEVITWGLQGLCALMTTATAVSAFMQADGVEMIHTLLKGYPDVEEVWDLGTKCLFQSASVTAIATVNRCKVTNVDKTILKALFRFKDVNRKSVWVWTYARPLLKMMGCSEKAALEDKMTTTLLKAQPKMLPVIARRFAAKKLQTTSYKEKQRLFTHDRRARRQLKRLPEQPK
eukprot:INCI17160.10.p1 GENE.INCI17160.10~~INCI17160.10.p1  ORF type:complete len:1189 (+),score=247.68 INCI17160.10:491-3568(+)